MFSRFKPQGRLLYGGDQASSEGIYARGEWDRLRLLPEAARYGVIGAYLRHLDARSVLDIGCGEGLLAERLPRPPVETYVGVDFSTIAIARAKAKAIPHADFFVGDAQSWRPERRFDAIVFNEVLYYVDRPGPVMARLAEWLEPEGAAIASVFRTKNQWVWRLVEPLFETLDAVTVEHGSGLVWDLRLMRPTPRV